MTTANQPVQEFIPANISASEIMFDAGRMGSVMSLAKLMASGKSTVPKHLQGNEGDCAAIVIQSMQWGLNPYVVAQKTHLVNGNLGYEAQLVHAVLQASGAINGTFQYEYSGDGEALTCRVGAVLAGDVDITWNDPLKLSSVTTRNSPLWKTNPKQQFGYLQVKNWARQYAPGAILGIYTSDELETRTERDITPVATETHAKPATRAGQAKAAIAASKPAALPVVSVDEVIAEINRAQTLDALNALSSRARDLTSEEDYQAAGSAYAARKKALTMAVQAAPVDDFVAEMEAEEGKGGAI